MGGLRWPRRALPSYFAGPVGLLWLMLVLNNPGFRPMGESGGDVFVVRCPYDGHWRTGTAGGVTCEDCRERFVVAPCRCGKPGAAAVGRPDPANSAFESWRCRKCKEFFFAHLCPQCRALSTSLGDGIWQCADKHPAFLVGRCAECGWFAGQERSGEFRCEWGRHRTSGGEI